MFRVEGLGAMEQWNCSSAASDAGAICEGWPRSGVPSRKLLKTHLS